jgi:hypothetical protein
VSVAVIISVGLADTPQERISYMLGGCSPSSFTANLSSFTSRMTLPQLALPVLELNERNYMTLFFLFYCEPCRFILTRLSTSSTRMPGQGERTKKLAEVLPRWEHHVGTRPAPATPKPFGLPASFPTRTTSEEDRRHNQDVDEAADHSAEHRIKQIGGVVRAKTAKGTD